jgi:hypothetical protein
MRYKIRGDICEFMVGPTGRIASAVDIADAFDTDGDDVILLDIHSGGGHIDAEIYLLNALRKARRRGKRIVTYTPGVVASAAADLLFQGEEIYMGDFSTVLVHNGFLTGLTIVGNFIYNLGRVVEWCRGGFRPMKTSELELHNAIISGAIPMEEFLEAYGEKGRMPNGDYCFTSHDLADILPGVVKVEDLPMELEALNVFELEDEMDGVIGEVFSDNKTDNTEED